MKNKKHKIEISTGDIVGGIIALIVAIAVFGLTGAVVYFVLR